MSKIKKIWNENRVLFVLGVILIICVVVVAIVSLTYFYGSSSNAYGNRLDSIKDTPLSDKFLNSIKTEMNSKDDVKNTNVKVKGKIVYIELTFNDGTKMDDAKKTAKEAIKLFSEKELGLYDLQFTIKTAEYTLMGAHNSNGSASTSEEEDIIWNNYTIKEETEEKASE